VALQNLIQNALKYSPTTSLVTVRLHQSGDMAFVEVADHGAGVQPQDRMLIFTKYYRAPGQRTKGSGLGLFLSREIARQHGGELDLVASDTAGSTFRLPLPLAKA
jgi:signal transduction histidine kinase